MKFDLFNAITPNLKPPGFRLPPLLFAAGAAAAAAAGAYFLYRTRDRQQTLTAESAVQTTPEDPVLSLRSAFGLVDPSALSDLYWDYIGRPDTPRTEVITEENGQLLVRPLPGPVAVYSCPRLFQQWLFQNLGPKELHTSGWTVRFSYTRWYDRGSRRICVRRHFVLLIRGAVSKLWWILTNDFFTASSTCPIWYAAAHRTTFAMRVEGHLAQLRSYMFTEHLSERFNIFQVPEVVRTYQDLVINDDGWTASVCSGSEVLPANPEPESRSDSEFDFMSSSTSRSSSNSSWQSTSEDDGDDPEDSDAPILLAYAEILNVPNFTPRLDSLRQAFDIILSNMELRNYVCFSSRMILGELATLNSKNLTVFQQLYDHLLEVAQNPSCHQGILEELAQIGIRHFNFIDIVYEVVLLGVMAGTRSISCPTPEGFLSSLMALISSFSDSSEERTPRAKCCQFLIQAAMLGFLENVLDLEDSVYEAPETLATLVGNLLQDHTKQLMDHLQSV